MNLRKTLICLLGGVTQQEYDEATTASFYLGQRSAYEHAKSFAESINGTNADDWCKAVYNQLSTLSEQADRLYTQLKWGIETDAEIQSPSSSSAFDAEDPDPTPIQNE